MASARTKSLRARLWSLRAVSLLLNIGPTLALVIYAFIQGEPKTKLALGGTILAAIALGIVGILRKRFCRSTIWIIALGLWFALDHFLVALVVFAVCCFVDEIIISPLIADCKVKLVANKEIDRREVTVDEG